MGEGWGDFIAASFLNDPVIGGYVTGNALRGVRRASMASSPFTFADVKTGTMTEVHDAGEVWAAALWAARKALGGAAIERLVVTGMKLTPCNPTMLEARDAIVAADSQINNGVNRCKLLTAFASRQMGIGAISPNHNSTSQITVSTSLPPECSKVFSPQTFASTDIPKSIPDDNANGISSVINVPSTGIKLLRVILDASISHTYRGDLIIQVVSPNGQIATLSNREGGPAPNWFAVSLDITSYFIPGSDLASGQWRLFVSDVAAVDVGTINSFQLTITSMN
jgi:subtilisin-like proprotein convertase family protein